MRIRIPLPEGDGEFIVNTGVCDGQIKEEQEILLDKELPGMYNLPLRVNINRLIQCGILNDRPDTKSGVVIPKNLKGSMRMMRIIYECSGIMRGTTLTWNVDSVKKGANMFKHLGDILKEEDTYIQLLTDLWAFLITMAKDKVDFYILQSLKKALLKEKPKGAENREYIEGTYRCLTALHYDKDVMGKLLAKLVEAIPDIQNMDFSTAQNGMPAETYERIHYTLLQEFRRLHSDGKNPHSRLFHYVVWVKKTFDIDEADLPQARLDDVRYDYNNYDRSLERIDNYSGRKGIRKRRSKKTVQGSKTSKARKSKSRKSKTNVAKRAIGQ